jgi:hypothetical protein
VQQGSESPEVRVWQTCAGVGCPLTCHA